MRHVLRVLARLQVSVMCAGRSVVVARCEGGINDVDAAAML